MPVVFCSFVPHPPIIVPSVGREQFRFVKKTVAALKGLGDKFKNARPELVICVSPHGTVHPDTFLINCSTTFTGNLIQFGDPTVNLSYDGNPAFCSRLYEMAKLSKIPVQTIEISELDHGVVVPLYYLAGNKKISLVPTSYCWSNLITHFDYGNLIYQSLEKSSLRVALVASGDLSHRLTLDSPAGYSPKGSIFDNKILELISSKQTNEILNLDQALIEAAGECGYRSLIILLGFLSNIDYQPKILSYEGPFGVGYSVIDFKI